MDRIFNSNELTTSSDLKQRSMKMVDIYEKLNEIGNRATELLRKKRAANAPVTDQFKRAVVKLERAASCLTWLLRIIIAAIFFLSFSLVFPTFSNALSQNGQTTFIIIFLAITVMTPMLWVKKGQVLSFIKRSKKGCEILNQARTKDVLAAQEKKAEIGIIESQLELCEQERLEISRMAKEHEAIFAFWLEWAEMARRYEIKGASEADDITLMKEIVDQIPMGDGSPATATIIAMSAFDSYKQQKQE